MLAYNLFGTNPEKELLMCHGMFGKKNNFNSLARAFENDYKVFSVDMLGHGDSPRSNLTYELFAKSLKAFIEENMKAPVNLLGHSMGGKAVMNFALEYSDLVDKLVVLDVAPKNYSKHFAFTKKLINFLLDIDLKTIKSRKEATELLIEKGIEKSVVLFIMQSLQKGDDDSFYWLFDLSALSNYAEEINNFTLTDKKISTKKTLFLRGSYSDFILDEDLDLLKSVFPNSRLEDVSNAGHNIHIDNPKETISHIKNFLKD